jgi:lipopolysaccharide transport system permease protein
MAYVPALVALLVVTTAGAGILLSALTVQYRDVRHAMEFVLQVLLYTAPVVWPASLVPPEYRPWYGLYPIAGVIEGFRAALLGAPMPWDLLGPSAAGALILLMAAVAYFRSVEDTFADIA